MRVSIAMATYNGGRFLQDQLDSFVEQTHRPDELIVCDDGSSDDTLEIAQRFAATAPFDVVVQRNPTNLGYSRNFQGAIARCTGDIIFLSDQDDVWFPDKIQRGIAVLATRPDAQVAVNDQVITDASLDHTGVTKLHNLARLNLGSDGLIEGCCTCFRRSFGELLFPMPFPEQELAGDLSHDRWLNEIAIFLLIRAVIPEPLQYFRRHGENTTSWIASEPRPVGSADLISGRLPRAPVKAWLDRAEVLRLYDDWLRKMRPEIERQTAGDVDHALARINHERQSLEARAALASSAAVARLAGIWKLWSRGGYAYFHGWKSALQDIVRGA